MISNYRRLFASALLAIALALPMSAASDKAVVVISSDGAQTEVALDDLKRIDIGSESATVHLINGDSKEHAYADIDRILIGADKSAIESVLGEGDIAIWPTVTSGPVFATGLDRGAALVAYDLGGSLVASVSADSNGSASVDLSGCPAGVYIIKANKHSVKIIKK